MKNTVTIHEDELYTLNLIESEEDGLTLIRFQAPGDRAEFQMLVDDEVLEWMRKAIENYQHERAHG